MSKKIIALSPLVALFVTLFLIGSCGSKKEEKVADVIKGRMVVKQLPEEGGSLKGKAKLRTPNITNVLKLKRKGILAGSRQRSIISSVKRKARKYLLAEATKGQPLVGAAVVAIDIETNQQIGNPTNCDSQGYFELTGIPPGTESFIIVGLKIEGATDITVIKIAVVTYPGGTLTLPDATPQTTLAAENYAQACQEAYKANPEAYDPKKIDYEQYIEQYAKKDESIVLKLYGIQDDEYDKIGADAITTDVGIPTAEIDAIGYIISTVGQAFEDELEQIQGWEQKEEQLDAALDQAWQDLQLCLAEKVPQASEDEYYVKLASKLSALGINVTVDQLETRIAEAEARLNAVLNNPASTAAQIEAAWTRYWAEEMMILAGIEITNGMLEELDGLTKVIVDAYIADLSGCYDYTPVTAKQKGSSGELSQKCMNYFNAINALWEYTDNQVVKVATQAINITVTDEEIAKINQLFYEGYADCNNNGQPDAGESINWETIEQVAINAAGEEPTCTPTVSGDLCVKDPCMTEWEAYWDKYDEAFNDALLTQLSSLIQCLGIPWDVKVVFPQVMAVSEAAWEVEEEMAMTDWCALITATDAATKACWTNYNTAVEAAYTNLGITQEQIANAFANACQMLNTALAQVSQQGVTFSEEVIKELQDVCVAFYWVGEVKPAKR